MVATVVSYRLRSGPPTPSLNDCGAHAPDQFIMQTFGVDKTITDVYDAKTKLLKSSDMQGQKPGDVEDPTYIETTFTSASYQTRGLKTTDGEMVFSGSEVHSTSFVDEAELGI